MSEAGLRMIAGFKPRVAYTINHKQPVQCTYISREPLFYVEFEPVEEPDGNAWCEKCKAVRPFHILQDFDPACPPEHRYVCDYICCTCDHTMFREYLSEEDLDDLT